MVSKKRRITKKRRGGGGFPGKIYVFYHIFCNKNTGPIVKDQCLRIIFSNLYSHVETIHCFLVGEQEGIHQVQKLLSNFGRKFKVAATGPGDTTYERFTLLKIPSYIKPEDKFLYIHSKGVRHSEEKTLEEFGNINPKELIDNIYWWRTWMEYYLMTKHRECLEKLNTHDIVGINYSKKGIGSHFSGNFWWSTGKYYLSLPNTIVDTGQFAYNEPERYIFTNTAVKYFDMGAGQVVENEGLYRNVFYPKEYVN